MGSKGSQTITSQNQSQTYTPNATTTASVTDALSRAQSAASTPFSQPVAPVANFSTDQTNAFNTIRNAQGYALPYYNTAANLYQNSANTNVNQYLNPYANYVLAGLQDTYGKQMAQTTGSLTNAAGGVGADRIAVGQSELARQQGLATGQTLSGIYSNALSAAQNQQNIQQGAAAGIANTGTTAQNSIFSGAQQQLSAGSLQQQEDQAKQNAVYKNTLAKLSYPFQTASYLSGITGSLSPLLGGTTTGTGTGYTGYPASSIWGTVAGLGTTALGASGLWSNSNSDSGSASVSDPTFGGYSLSGTNAASVKSAQGGVVDDSGSKDSVPNEPIDSAPKSVVPTENLQTAKQNIPQLNMNLNPSRQSGSTSSGGSDISKMITTGVELAAMFAARGGRAPNPYFAEGGDSDTASPYSSTERFTGAFSPYSSPALATDQNRALALAIGDKYNPQGGIELNAGVPLPRSRPIDAPGGPAPNAVADNASLQPTVSDAGPSVQMPGGSPYSMPDSNTPDIQGPGSDRQRPPRGKGAMDSPWAAVLSAGLGMLAASGQRDARGLPLSPFAVIGQGGLQGLKTLQGQREAQFKADTLDQSARRLDQSAEQSRQHLDLQRQQLAETKRQHDLTAHRYDQQLELNKQQRDLQNLQPVKIGNDAQGRDIYAIRDPKTQQLTPLDPTTGRPAIAPNTPANSGNSTFIDPRTQRPIQQQASTTGDADVDGVIPTNAQLVSSGTPYDYSSDAPYIEKGMDVPKPSSVAGKSTGAIQTDAEYYLQTGKLPPIARGKSPVAIQTNNYRNAVQNYGTAMAQSRGLSPEQTAEMWRSAPGMMRFILGADGRSTVALGTAVRHLDTVQQLAKAWEANDTQTINRIRAVISREFGRDAATNLEAAGRIVGPEIIKALGVAGAGTEHDRDTASAMFSSARSPAQLAGAATTVQSLLGGQLEGRKRQAAAAGVSEERFKGLIGDRPYEILTNVDKQPSTTTKTGAIPAARRVRQNGHTYEEQSDGSMKAID